jgi:hypothetical protein
MFRKLVATTALLVVVLVPSLALPAQAAGATDTASRTSTVITANSVEGARLAVSDVLAANDASRLWPRVDADLTPQLEKAANAGGGTIRTEVIGWPIKIVIKCEITFPPLKIKCTVDIIIDL